MELAILLESGLALLVVVDPLGLVPIYMGMTARMSPDERRRTTNVAVVSGVSILLAFSLAGEWLLAHAFHVIKKTFFLQNYQYWTLTRNDPALIEIPEQESFDVNTDLEFRVAEEAYKAIR